MVLQVVGARGVRAQAGHDRGAARRAERELAVGVFETGARFREAVDVRRFHRRVAVAAEVVVHVIDGDEQDVGLFGGMGGGEAKQEGKTCFREHLHSSDAPHRAVIGQKEAPVGGNHSSLREGFPAKIIPNRPMLRLIRHTLRFPLMSYEPH